MTTYTDLAVNLDLTAFVTAYQGVVGAAPARFAAPDYQYDPNFGGPGRVRGSVSILATGQPLRRRVALFDVRSLVLLRTQWSGEDGLYAFDNLRYTPYIVLAQDYAGNYNAVTADQVMPEPMP